MFQTIRALRRELPRPQDAPCPTCQKGYDGPHGCESLRYCPCDRPDAHTVEVSRAH